MEGRFQSVAKFLSALPEPTNPVDPSLLTPIHTKWDPLLTYLPSYKSAKLPGERWMA